ncbi:MAG: hypothetical protein V3V31_06630, partial [Methylococcales bacterium]
MRDGPVSARTLPDFYPAISVGKVKGFFYMQGQTDISGKNPNSRAAIFGNTHELPRSTKSVLNSLAIWGGEGIMRSYPASVYHAEIRIILH